MANFNNGNLSYELLIRSNTIILDLGKYEPSQTFKEAIPLKLNEIFNTSERVLLEAYIKTNFAEIHNNKLNIYIGYGSVTDGTFKLEIHIKNFMTNDYLKLEIKKGDKVEVIGVIQTVDPVYLLVNDLKDIQKLSGHMSLPILLKGVQIPQKRKIEENIPQQVNLLLNNNVKRDIFYVKRD
ncbi:unnamed protein product [Lasius platythorax]|uniref:Uncharacterized protein n=1 Tax=Lasius platythorax TaxID=488582 RepID=A0AAV2P014_9HYME